MKPKTYLTLLICAWMAFLNVVPVSAAKDYRAEVVDVLITIQPDGSLWVVEETTYRFNGGPFTYVYREISPTGTEAIQILDVSMDGVPLSPGRNEGQVEISGDDPISVTWHFSPASDAVRVFTLSYLVKGAIRHDENADTLNWMAIPTDHDYAIDRTSIRLAYPEETVPLNDPVLTGVPASLEMRAGKAIFIAEEIDPGTGLNVVVEFPSGSLVNNPPDWQIQQSREEIQETQRNAQIEKSIPLGLGAAVLAGILGLGGVILFSRRFRRDEINSADLTQTYLTPPGPETPALAAALIMSGTAFLGTLFDLARRGVLVIEEGPKKWGSRTYDVIRQPFDHDLAPHEHSFLKTLFHKAKDGRTSLSNISSLVYSGDFSKAVEAEFCEAGWRDLERSRNRTLFMVLSVLGFVVAAAVFVLGLVLMMTAAAEVGLSTPAGIIFMGAGAGLGIASLAGLIAAAATSTLSIKGQRQSLAWSSFAGHLKNITRGREPSVNPDIFERYLPYAAGFGLATEWAKYFQKMTDIPVPAWFQGLESSMEDGSFAAILAAISVADSSAAVATGADGGGASGGGSSGAG